MTSTWDKNCILAAIDIWHARGSDLPSSTTDLGQGQTDTPDLTLVLEAILANELKLRVTIIISVSFGHKRLKQRQALVHWPVNTDSRADSKGLRGTREVLEWARGGILNNC